MIFRDLLTATERELGAAIAERDAAKLNLTLAERRLAVLIAARDALRARRCDGCGGTGHLWSGTACDDCKGTGERS